MSLTIEAERELLERCDQLEQQVLELTTLVTWYQEQHRKEMHKRFAPSSEATPDQLRLLFNEAEVLADAADAAGTADAQESADAAPTETITYQRRKFEGQREEKFSKLPVEKIPHDLSDEERICPNCNGLLHRIGTEVRKHLHIEPAKVIVHQHEYEICACRKCQKDATETPVITAPMPTPAFPGSFASPSSVAYIMGQKFVEGLPLYRQEKALLRLGVDLSRQTMANWMIKGADWLEIIYGRLHQLLVLRDILHADETTLQVLHEEGRTANNKSYLWLYRTGRFGPHIVLFEYQETRAGEHPKRFLNGFHGYLHVDCYQAYNILAVQAMQADGTLLPPDVVLCGCLTHARRGFKEALDALAPAALKSGTQPAATHGLKFCNDLFKIERDLRDANPEERLAGRKERSAVVIQKFYDWLHGPQASNVLPQGGTGKAIAYCINNWGKLTQFLNDGRLEIDNNRSERTIKNVVIGRKNWLFANTPSGAKASATIYSIIETAKENGLNPYTYLTYLFEQLPNIDAHDIEALDKLLPWSETLPKQCRSPV
jgi:transposase